MYREDLLLGEAFARHFGLSELSQSKLEQLKGKLFGVYSYTEDKLVLDNGTELLGDPWKTACLEIARRNEAPQSLWISVDEAAGRLEFAAVNFQPELTKLSLPSVIATVRETTRYASSNLERWLYPLLGVLGFKTEDTPEALVATRGSEQIRVPKSGDRISSAHRKPPSPAPLVARLTAKAQEKLEDKDLDGAHKEVEAALRLAPEDYAANLVMGRVLNQQGQMEAAELHLLLAGLLKKRATFPLTVLASLYDKRQQTELAVVCRRRCLELDQNHTYSLVHLGELLGKQDKAAEGLAYLERGVALEKSAYRLRKLAFLYLKVEPPRRSDALQAYCEAVELDPSDDFSRRQIERLK